MEAQFKVGDEVEWTSSSNGSTTTKRGIVEDVIDARKSPTPAQCREADTYGVTRDQISYMVRVSGKTITAKGKLYWPRTSSLKPMFFPNKE